MPFTSREGVRIHYELDGTGPTIVSVPALGANLEVGASAGWAGAFPGYRVISVEPRGHGRSDKPKDPRAHRIEEYLEDVRAVVDAEHVDRAVYWGVSDGSEVCGAFADAYPHRVIALMDHDGWDDRDMCEDPLRQGRLDLAKEVRGRGWESMIRSFAAEEGVQGEARPVLEFMKCETEMVALELEEWTHWKGPASILPRLKVPVLRLMNGKRAPDEIERIQKAALGNVELHVIPGIGHWQICLEPEHTLPLIREFLARVAPARSPPST